MWFCPSLCQVWCVQPDSQQSLNWTVGGGTHSLQIDGLDLGRQYWVTMAAANGAGVGVQSNPHRLILGQWCCPPSWYELIEATCWNDAIIVTRI